MNEEGRQLVCVYTVSNEDDFLAWHLLVPCRLKLLDCHKGNGCAVCVAYEVSFCKLRFRLCIVAYMI